MTGSEVAGTGEAAERGSGTVGGGGEWETAGRGEALAVAVGGETATCRRPGSGPCGDDEGRRLARRGVGGGRGGAESPTVDDRRAGDGGGEASPPGEEGSNEASTTRVSGAAGRREVEGARDGVGETGSSWERVGETWRHGEATLTSHSTSLPLHKTGISAGGGTTTGESTGDTTCRDGPGLLVPAAGTGEGEGGKGEGGEHAGGTAAGTTEKEESKDASLDLVESCGGCEEEGRHDLRWWLADLREENVPSHLSQRNSNTRPPCLLKWRKSFWRLGQDTRWTCSSHKGQVRTSELERGTFTTARNPSPAELGPKEKKGTNTGGMTAKR